MKKIIIVIDKVDLGGKTLINAIKALNHEAFHVETSNSAKHLISEHPVSLVIVAMMVQHRSGFDIAKELYDDTDTPIIGISADITREKCKRAKACGMKDIIARSTNLQELQHVIEQYAL